MMDVRPGFRSGFILALPVVDARQRLLGIVT